MMERILKRVPWAKVGAIALALFAWYRVTSIENPIQTRTTYVKLLLPEVPGKIVTEFSPAQVTVTVQGRAETLDRIDFDSLSIPLDVSSLEVGANQLPITFESPVGGVTVLDTYPKIASVYVDVEETKVIDVSVQTRGRPDEEYTAQAPVPGVGSVRVTGPRTDVEKVAAVVGVIDISGAAGSIEGQLVAVTAVDAQNNEVKNVTVDPVSIPVSVPMKQRPPAKMVAVKAATYGTPKKGYRVKSVSVEPASVRVRGDLSVTASLSSISAQSVDVTDRSETFTYEANLTVPQGIELESSRRVSVTVVIEEEMIQATYRNVIVQIESLPAGFKWKVNPTTVDITIEGRSDVVEAINDEDVQAFIDASWVKGAGSHKLVVNVKGLPDSVRFDAIVPSQVILELEVR